MNKQVRFEGNWHNGKQEIQVKVPMILFEEDGCQIIYCPALDINGYGKTEQEALESFHVSLSEFFLYTTRKGTLLSEMSCLGWKLRKQGKPMDPSTLQHLLEKNDNFNRIFNNFPFRKFVQPVTFPAVA